MHLTIPGTPIKLIMLTAVVWSTLSVIAVVALCSISDIANFYLVARPKWMLYAMLLVLWFFSLKAVSYGMFGRTTFYAAFK
jgi:hypothetical protein